MPKKLIKIRMTKKPETQFTKIPRVHILLLSREHSMNEVEITSRQSLIIFPKPNHTIFFISLPPYILLFLKTWDLMTGSMKDDITVHQLKHATLCSFFFLSLLSAI